MSTPASLPLDALPEPRSAAWRAPGRARIGPRLDPRSVIGLGRLGPMVGLLRWASLAVGVILLPTVPDPGDLRVLLALGLVGADTVLRSIRPLRLYPATWRAELLMLLDLTVAVVAIALTGAWASPFILCPLPIVILAAYGWGYREGILAALLTAATIGIADVAAGVSGPTLRTGVFVSIVVVLAALIGGFTRQLWLEAERSHRESRDQLSRMAMANDLLHGLHELVQTLPSSLDLTDVVASARDRFRELLNPSVVVVLVPDETSDHWAVALADGTRLPDALTADELPSSLAQALVSYGVVRSADDVALAYCDSATRSALTTALRARDQVVGLVAIESQEGDRFTQADADLLVGLASSLALAVDNARWFARLRTLGAEAERARIARDLHDRTAQSLAYVGLELDRLASVRDDAELQDLHAVVRGVVAELRETLYELRVTVSEERPLTEVAGPYVHRWSERTGVDATFSSSTEEGRRPPIQVEQELWRILQEALTNVERHADASHVQITWEAHGSVARLEITDDGRGITAGTEPRERYGLVGIRERADALGGTVTLASAPDTGTRVLVQVEVRE